MIISSEQMYAKNAHYPYKSLCPFLESMDADEKKAQQEENDEIHIILPTCIKEEKRTVSFATIGIGGIVGVGVGIYAVGMIPATATGALLLIIIGTPTAGIALGRLLGKMPNINDKHARERAITKLNIYELRASRLDQKINALALHTDSIFPNNLLCTDNERLQLEGVQSYFIGTVNNYNSKAFNTIRGI